MSTRRTPHRGRPGSDPSRPSRRSSSPCRRRTEASCPGSRSCRARTRCSRPRCRRWSRLGRPTSPRSCSAEPLSRGTSSRRGCRPTSFHLSHLCQKFLRSLQLASPPFRRCLPKKRRDRHRFGFLRSRQRCHRSPPLSWSLPRMASSPRCRSSRAARGPPERIGACASWRSSRLAHYAEASIRVRPASNPLNHKRANPVGSIRVRPRRTLAPWTSVRCWLAWAEISSEPAGGKA